VTLTVIIQLNCLQGDSNSISYGYKVKLLQLIQ